MTSGNFDQKIEKTCQRLTGRAAKLTSYRRLTGGASMETWHLTYGEQDMILRRMPDGAEDVNIVYRIPLSTEVGAIRAAVKAGVTTPDIIGELIPQDGLGGGFMMHCVEGEALPYKIFKNTIYTTAIASLTESCAAELSHIHSVPQEAFPKGIVDESTTELLDRLETDYRKHGEAVPVFELAFHSLRENMPETSERVLLHGDFRMGNLMISSQGISGVLDWELAHIGDPAQDLGYMCTPSWRFGNYAKTVGGFGDLDTLIMAYNRVSGRSISKSSVKYWMVYSSLWWGICCLNMIGIWREGIDRALERTVIGKRMSEVEIDVLMLLEDMAGITPKTVKWDVPQSTSPQDDAKGDTKNIELLQAMQGWIETDIMPISEGRNLFQARVARNALGILQRSTEMGPMFQEARNSRLKALGLTQAEFTQGLRNGRLTLSDPDISNHLRLTTLERLSIDQPKYAGLKTALKKWSP